jgi:hypothetical protein
VAISSYTSQKNFDKVDTHSDLWEALGENRVTHVRVDGNRRLLQDGFQNSTLSYITSALRTLKRAKKEFGELQQRVATREEGERIST